MSVIVPTITTADPAAFEQALTSLSSFAPRIHVDFSDGTFAPTQMVPLSSMTFPGKIQVELHIMSAKPSQYLPAIIQLKPALCIVHAEVNEDLTSFASELRGAGIKFGVALLRGTFPRRVQNLIADADHVMIFAGNLGQQGGTIDMLQIEKVPLIRSIKADVEIGWDGGANLSNVRALAHSGIDVINVGSAITKSPDHAAMYQSLLAEIEKKGVLI